MIKIGKFIPVTLLTLSTIALYACDRKHNKEPEISEGSINSVPNDTVELSTTKEKKHSLQSSVVNSLITLAEYLSAVYSISKFLHNIFVESGKKINTEKPSATQHNHSADEKIEAAGDVFIC